VVRSPLIDLAVGVVWKLEDEVDKQRNGVLFNGHSPCGSGKEVIKILQRPCGWEENETQL
jgi:hypothetical protein